MLPETLRLINLLKICLKILGISHREVARRLELSQSHVSKLFSGASEMRLDHVIRICEAVKLDPAEFFALAYPTPKEGTVAGVQLQEVLRSVPPAAPPPKPRDDEAGLEAMLRSMLTKMLNQGNGA